jgi:hypothetical protein
VAGKRDLLGELISRMEKSGTGFRLVGGQAVNG